jgi:hypothetical protein
MQYVVSHYLFCVRHVCSGGGVRGMIFNANFNNISAPSYPQKTSDLPQITDKLYHIMLHQVHIALSGVRTHNVSSDRH